VLIFALLTLTLAVVFGWYLWIAYREFGGITGDLAGYFLQVFELAALTVLTAAYWFPAC
jgi:adenosylcobinamide-GDP ribazoletransferase